MAQLIDIVPEDNGATGMTTARDRLASWVMTRVTSWAEHRDSEYKERWEEYYRLWRGIWNAKDKQRDSERSRIITPALQQAVESVTAEIESAVLDRQSFFDIADDVDDAEQETVADLRAKLREDYNEAKIEHALNQIFLNGSIYGTGIGKVKVKDQDKVTIVQGPTGPELATTKKVIVGLEVVLPTQFAIDPAAHSIADALGCAHTFTTPLHLVRQLQDSGSYMAGDVNKSPPEDAIESDEDPEASADSVNMVEYQGKVPLGLLVAAEAEAAGLEEDEELVSLLEPSDVDDADETLVEAIVVIGNDTLLRANRNPTLLEERLFVAYRHEVVPDQFWGRGVCEKGYNSQKALDASMRGRLDGLALTVHPMMGIDATRVPRGFRFAVQPGRTVLTTGNPEEVLKPVRFGNMDPNIFTNTSELERMVSMSTGGFDTAAPISANNRNETASGMSMMLGSFVKRSKRTIRNIESEFIEPFVKVTSRLYMQFAPERYPARDVTFKAVSVLGTMARELEQQQFASMLNTVPQDSPAFWMLLRSVYENSQLSNREEILPLIDAQLEKSLNPPPPPPDPLVELRKMEVLAKVRAENARIQVEYIRAQAEIARAANDARLADSEEARIEADAILKLAKAAAEEVGNQYQQYKLQLDQLEREAASTSKGLAEDVIERASRAGTQGDSGNV